jgi:predicted RNA-binding Zn-ribbon protein involved in translation (DUF1610 family)
MRGVGRLTTNGVRRAATIVHRANTDADFLPDATQLGVMNTTRQGLRKGNLEKDNYERLHCTECEKALKTQNDPDEVYTLRVCPECGSEWKEIG